jgi:nucleotide-binding universal stress UspA family protein
MVGYRDDEHGADALALARMLAAAEAVSDVRVVEVGDEARPDVGEGWPAHARVAVRELPGGSPADALNAVALEEDIDLLVLGSTHRGFAGRAFVGTTAGHVLRGASRPVAIAPPGFRDAAARGGRVGVAFDGSEEAGFALAWAAAAAPQLGAEIRLLAVVEPPPPVEAWGADVPGGVWSDRMALAEASEVGDVLREQMDHRLEAARESLGRPGTEVVTVVGDPLHELRTAAEDLGLLVVGSHPHGTLSSVLLHSVSRGLAHSCPAPLVVVPEPSTATTPAADASASAPG